VQNDYSLFSRDIECEKSSKPSERGLQRKESPGHAWPPVVHREGKAFNPGRPSSRRCLSEGRVGRVASATRPHQSPYKPRSEGRRPESGQRNGFVPSSVGRERTSVVSQTGLRNRGSHRLRVRPTTTPGVHSGDWRVEEVGVGVRRYVMATAATKGMCRSGRVQDLQKFSVPPKKFPAQLAGPRPRVMTTRSAQVLQTDSSVSGIRQQG